MHAPWVADIQPNKRAVNEDGKLCESCDRPGAVYRRPIEQWLCSDCNKDLEGAAERDDAAIAAFMIAEAVLLATAVRAATLFIGLQSPR